MLTRSRVGSPFDSALVRTPANWSPPVRETCFVSARIQVHGPQVARQPVAQRWLAPVGLMGLATGIALVLQWPDFGRFRPSRSWSVWAPLRRRRCVAVARVSATSERDPVRRHRRLVRLRVGVHLAAHPVPFLGAGGRSALRGRPRAHPAALSGHRARS